MKNVRGLLYLVAKLLGDIASVKKGKVNRRAGRRVAGKGTGRLLRKFFK